MRIIKEERLQRLDEIIRKAGSLAAKDGGDPTPYLLMQILTILTE